MKNWQRKKRAASQPQQLLLLKFSVLSLFSFSFSQIQNTDFRFSLQP